MAKFHPPAIAIVIPTVLVGVPLLQAPLTASRELVVSDDNSNTRTDETTFWLVSAVTMNFISGSYLNTYGHLYRAYCVVYNNNFAGASIVKNAWEKCTSCLELPTLKSVTAETHPYEQMKIQLAHMYVTLFDIVPDKKSKFVHRLSPWYQILLSPAMMKYPNEWNRVIMTVLNKTKHWVAFTKCKTHLREAKQLLQGMYKVKKEDISVLVHLQLEVRLMATLLFIHSTKVVDDFAKMKRDGNGDMGEFAQSFEDLQVVNRRSAMYSPARTEYVLQTYYEKLLRIALITSHTNDLPSRANDLPRL